MSKIAFISRESFSKVGVEDVENISLELLQSSPPTDVDAFLVDSVEDDYTSTVLRVIRNNPRPAVYLRPIIMLNRTRTSSNFAKVADAEVHLDELTSFSFSKVLDSLSYINQRLEALPDLSQSSDSNVSFKIVRYLYTRQRGLEPTRGIAGRQGFSYPEVEIMLSKGDDSVLHLLDFLESQQLLHADFVEKVHLCNRCQSAYLNFLEVCPHCQSSNLVADDLVHHFSCAHVAPEQEFRNGTKLTCPKCEIELKHIGVDYDKPSSVFRCGSCRHSFQDPIITTVCYDCGLKTEPENLILRSVKKYELSGIAENAAIYGLDSLFRRILEQDVNLITYDVFKIMLRVEVERIKRYKLSTSSLVLFEIVDLDKVYLKFGERAKEIFGEISMIIKSVMRESDIVTSLNDSVFMAVLVETGEGGAQTALHRLRDQVVQLFSRNLEEKIDVQTRTVAIGGDDSPSELLDRITQEGSPQNAISA